MSRYPQLPASARLLLDAGVNLLQLNLAVKLRAWLALDNLANGSLRSRAGDVRFSRYPSKTGRAVNHPVIALLKLGKGARIDEVCKATE
jgi:hypothetical protein